MGFHQTLADGQTQTGPSDPSLFAADTHMFPEQVRQQVPGHASSFVQHGDRHVNVLSHGADADWGRLGSVSGCVGEEVVQDLDDALPVSHHPGQVCREIDLYDVPPSTAQASGINTGAALRNFGSEALRITCRLMQGGDVLEPATIELEGDGQKAQFIHELFPNTDTTDFVGSVHCTAPPGKRFTGVALELDAANRIFTTLPLVPVGAANQDTRLIFAHFANGDATTSDLVLVNVGTVAVRPAIYFYDPKGQPIDAASVVDVTGNLKVTDEGALTIGRGKIKPLGEWTVSTTGKGELVAGSVRVVSDGPIGGVLRFRISSWLCYPTCRGCCC